MNSSRISLLLAGSDSNSFFFFVLIIIFFFTILWDVTKDQSTHANKESDLRRCTLGISNFQGANARLKVLVLEKDLGYYYHELNCKMSGNSLIMRITRKATNLVSLRM